MRIKNAYLSRKVAKINDKLYASLEKIEHCITGNEMIVLREVKLVERMHQHFAGDTLSRVYNKAKAPKMCVLLDEWNKLEDINTDLVKVDISSNCF